MGSGSIQGKLWGARARDWAQTAEHISLNLFGAVLDAARVTTGTIMLDAGSGAGMAAVLASLRGAQVSAVDASTAQLEIARERMPDADIREADLEDLPFPDHTFDGVIAVNSVSYAENPVAALRELARVTRPGGRVVVTTWGPAEKCDQAIVLRALSPPHATPTAWRTTRRTICAL